MPPKISHCIERSRRLLVLKYHLLPVSLGFCSFYGLGQQDMSKYEVGFSSLTSNLRYHKLIQLRNNIPLITIDSRLL